MRKDYQYDAFISHAVEDKLPIANELCKRLEEAGLDIWYSGKELSVGDSVKDTIEDGLRNSKFGIVVLSKHYIEKSWTMRELHFFTSMEEQGDKKLLPILFDITVDQLADKHLPLADRYALKYERGLDFIVDKLLAEIRKTEPPKKKVFISRRTWLIGIAAACALVVGVLMFSQSIEKSPSDELLSQTVATRIQDLENKIQLELNPAMQVDNGKTVTLTSLDSMFSVYLNTKSRFRNEYFLSTGYSIIKSKKNVESLLGVDLDAMAPANHYAFQKASWYRFKDQQRQGSLVSHFAFVNQSPLEYTLKEKMQIDEDEYELTVTYGNNIRFISVILQFPVDDIKRHQMSLIAALPQETYFFKRKGGQWELTRIE